MGVGVAQRGSLQRLGVEDVHDVGDLGAQRELRDVSGE